MGYFVDQLINGLTLGSVYGLIAIGYTMVYGIIGMINFAHGEVFMIGAFISLIVLLLLAQLGVAAVPVAILVALVLTAVFTALWGFVVERIAYRPLRGSFRLAPLISAIGMSIFLQNLVQLLQGARVKPLPPVLTGRISLGSIGDHQLSVAVVQVVIVVVTVVLMAGFSLLVSRTALGRAQRACEQDRRMAELVGVNVDRTISLTFVFGAALAAVAGLLYTIYYGSIDFFIGFFAGLKAFTAAVLGGIGSLPRAMLGGLLIGLIEALWSAYSDIQYKDVAVFAILVLILLFRPTGLLGRQEVEKV
ncbi:branched-chain amino acid ABC transporter permease [Chelatococcus sp. GW1]|uniref:ABC transporter permease subunit n=1 Tax=Chelatococcus sp. GW1 TaxID=1211115 RepID=UPI0002FB0E3F|nr:branched-chain amino acid ABC transporter permease [Chelatococcus sp. GW1]